MLGVKAGLPLLAIRIPKVGNLSRKERDENKELFGAHTAYFNLLDLDRLEKSMPEPVDQLKGLIFGAPRRSDGAGGAQGIHLNSRPASAGLGKVAGAYRLRLADKYREKHEAFERTGDPRTTFAFSG